MIEFWIGLIGVAMAALGALVSVIPPKERQFRILSLTAFGVGSVLLVVLLWIHANDNAKEKAEATNAQRETRIALIQAQKEFRDFRNEVNDATKRAQQPGPTDERLNSVLTALTKTLGKPPLTVNPPSTALSPVDSGTAILKMAQATTVPSRVVTATSKIQVGSFDDNVSGSLRVTNIVPGVSFDIVSSNGADAGKVFWIIYP
jgi:hypothetical protein